ncbi:hypothetical protein AAFF_G00095010 [Aldrovandia affinis]|uniref:Uncharacterized protein n=1 Tax=Aldrovandia affinis TaxID=143900 RepID=A0AAD7RVU4_9TELE|nr:hypothetical protein AAFF_G00095010 [Aldrovandia affinis]
MTLLPTVMCRDATSAGPRSPQVAAAAARALSCLCAGASAQMTHFLRARRDRDRHEEKEGRGRRHRSNAVTHFAPFHNRVRAWWRDADVRPSRREYTSTPENPPTPQTPLVPFVTRRTVKQ